MLLFQQASTLPPFWNGLHILDLLRKLDAEAPRILDELEQEEVVAVLEELLTWLTEIQPRVRSYLTRRARQRPSRDLDEQMVGDLHYYLLLLVNFTLLRERLLREPLLA